MKSFTEDVCTLVRVTESMNYVLQSYLIHHYERGETAP